MNEFLGFLGLGNTAKIVVIYLIFNVLVAYSQQLEE